jgi:PAS domain S-box-containing protein
MNPFVLLSLIGFVASLFLGIFVFLRNPRQYTNRMFLLLGLSVSFWGFTEFGLRDADTGLDARVWFDLFSLWHLSLPILLHFSLVFSEKGRYLRNPFVPIALYTPALAFIILDIWQHHVLGLPLKVYWGWTYALKSDALFKVDMIWVFAMGITSVIVSMRHFLLVRGHSRKKQAKYVALGICVPVVTGIVTYSVEFYTQKQIPDFTITTFVIAFALIGYGIWKHRLFNLSPAMAADNIISTMTDGLIIVNDEDTIRMVNNAMCKMLAMVKDELIGRPLDAILADSPPTPALSDRTWFSTFLSAGCISDIPASLKASNQRMVPVSLSASTLKDDNDEISGMVFICRDITERKRAEEALQDARSELESKVALRTEELNIELANRMLAEEEIRNSERRYRGIVEDHTEIICRFLPDTTLTFVNTAFCRYFGAGQESLVGHPLLRIIASSDRDAFRAQMDECARSDKPAPIECRVRAKDGAVRWQHLVVRPLYDEFAGFAEFQAVGADITDRKAAEDELAAEKERLAVTLASIGDAVITTDTAGRIRLVNSAGGRLTGWPQSEAFGRNIDECLYLVNERSMARRPNPLSDIVATRGDVSIDDDTLLVARDGSRRSISCIGAPIKETSGRIVGMVLVIRDITDRKTLEAELFKARKLESMGVLAAGIANDFSVILSEIVTHLFAAKIFLKAGDDAYRSITSAEAAAFRASRITKQLLTFSKGGALVKERSSIKALIEDSVGFSLSGSSAAYRLDLPENLLPVDIDRGQIDQAMSNLVVNADQAMRPGGTITISARNVTIGANSERSGSHVVRDSNLEPGNYVCISIQDEGVGIPAENLEKIFDPYFTTKPNCNGLGLTTAYSIIRKHDGYITVSSEPGKGSTFNVYLPAEAPDGGGMNPHPGDEEKIGLKLKVDS